jgi:hypothetical protein
MSGPFSPQERAAPAGVGNGVRFAEFLTRPRPLRQVPNEGRGLSVDPAPMTSSQRERAVVAGVGFLRGLSSVA